MNLFLAGASMAISFILVGPDKMPKPWHNPGYNQLAWIQSPNCGVRPKGTVVDTIVLHSTVNPTLENTTNWFQTSKSQVSSHFTIGKDGSIVENVSTFNRAWHAGASKDSEGRTNVNNFSIGIELVNLDDGKDPYPPAQIRALHNLVLVLKRRFPLKYMVSHAYIAVPKGRKIDPNGYPWATLSDVGLKLVP
ncbi:MAG TPA: N-acetylmuramoyl-L-alanine amidase [Fimbriimonadaceae bacterium]|jgi:N-acetyl-anhydromuramyl-L-alanine amidase AmpD